MKYTVQITKENIGKDDILRVTFSTWENSIWDIQPKLEQQTPGVLWEFFGCFMDTCCMATRKWDKSLIGRTIEFELP